MHFSIITPSYNQLDWLRLCIASVRDQILPGGQNPEIEDRRSEMVGISSGDTAIHPLPSSISQLPSSAAVGGVEHIIQDAGTPGIEEFAREIGADFYRDGELVFTSSGDGRSEMEDRENALDDSPSAINHPPSRYRLAVYCERDAGMYDAVNRGLACATGEICAYLNCDDQYLPGALQTVAEFFLRNRNVEMVFGDVVVVDEEGEYLCSRLVTVPTRWHTQACTLSIFTAATFFRRHLASESKILFRKDWKVIGDVLWILDHIDHGTKMRELRRTLSAATETGENLILSERGAEEMRRIGTSVHPLARLLRPFLTAVHRLRRLARGAYSPRPFTYSIFTRQCPFTRVSVEVKCPSFRLPGRFG